MEAKRDSALSLLGDGFYLRLWKREDAAWYVSARDEEIFKWTTEKRDLTVEETEEAIERVNSTPSLRCFAIVGGQVPELLGNIALVIEENNPNNAEIMYWLARQGRGRGIATKAVNLLCDWAFHAIGIDRITLKTLPGNVRSQRVAQRAGFRLQKLEISSVSDCVWFERFSER